VPLSFQPVHRIAHAVLMTSFWAASARIQPDNNGLKRDEGHWRFVSTACGTGFRRATSAACVLYSGLSVDHRPQNGMASLRVWPDSPVPNRRDLSDSQNVVLVVTAVETNLRTMDLLGKN
jgi:hypothetical protein